MDLSQLTRHYIIFHRKHSDDELEWFRNQSSLEAAIECAALALDSRGKRFSHQTRIKHESLQQANVALSATIGDLGQCQTFDELLNTIQCSLQHIQGLGELYCYDTALRIGARLGLFPQRVYLHSGTRDGTKIPGLDYKARAIETSELPSELQCLAPHELEDFLCIYKNKLAR